jgi:hypothetical protein
VRLVARRGLARVALPLEDRGAMASCAAERPAILEALAALPPEHREGGRRPVVAANLNHPQQTVISGHSAGVAAARALLEGRGVKVTALEVSHAFHSPLMAGLRPALEEIVAPLALRAPQAKLVSGITAGLYPSAAERIREIWLRHSTAPVDFQAALRTAAAPEPAGAGARIFLQVGAGAALAAFAYLRVFPLALLLMMLVGGGVILAAASTNTILQTIVDDRLRGRVAGFYTMAFLGVAPLGNLAAGALAAAWGTPATFLANGLLCIAAAFWFWRRLPALAHLLRPTYRRLGNIVDDA